MPVFLQLVPAASAGDGRFWGIAARIAGASELGAFYRIMLPLIIPALAALGIFSLQGTWNDFLWPHFNPPLH